MIRVSKCLNLEDYGLLLQDDSLTITKNIDKTIYIDGSITINVMKNINVKI